MVDEIVSALRRFLNLTDKGMTEISEAALQVADKLLWKDLIVNYQKAWDVALEKSGGRHYMMEPVPYAELLHEVVYQKNDAPSWKKVLVKPGQRSKMIQCLRICACIDISRTGASTFYRLVSIVK